MRADVPLCFHFASTAWGVSETAVPVSETVEASNEIAYPSIETAVAVRKR